MAPLLYNGAALWRRCAVSALPMTALLMAALHDGAAAL